MSVSVGQLVSDAKELVMRLKEREKSLDHVVLQSNALAKKVDAIQQVTISASNQPTKHPDLSTNLKTRE